MPVRSAMRAGTLETCADGELQKLADAIADMKLASTVPKRCGGGGGSGTRVPYHGSGGGGGGGEAISKINTQDSQLDHVVYILNLKY
jgi:hypothetical protein